MSQTDFWKARPYLKSSLAHDLKLYENWIGTHEIRLDEFSRNRFSSWPENWNFGKIFGWVFQDLLIRVKNFNRQTQRGKWIQRMGNKTFELLHSNGALFRSFNFVSCDSSNSVLFSILFPFTIIHQKERNSKITGKWTNQMPTLSMTICHSHLFIISLVYSDVFWIISILNLDVDHEKELECQDKSHAKCEYDLNQSCCVRYASPAGTVTVGWSWNY